MTVGQVYNRWTVLELIPKDPGPPVIITRARCQCECGTVSVVFRCHFVSGASKSCGCWNKEYASARATARNFKHGHTVRGKHSREWNSWMAMHERCRDPNSINYKNYGGRGISVCARWADFNNFLSDMGPRPPGHSLDRINNEGSYEPSNCKWSTWVEQNNNRRPKSRHKKDLTC